MFRVSIAFCAPDTVDDVSRPPGLLGPGTLPDQTLVVFMFRSAGKSRASQLCTRYVLIALCVFNGSRLEYFRDE